MANKDRRNAQQREQRKQREDRLQTLGREEKENELPIVADYEFAQEAYLDDETTQQNNEKNKRQKKENNDL